MENFLPKHPQPPLPEIVFASSDSRQSRTIHQAIKVGRLRNLAPRLYTSNLKDPPDQIVRRNLYLILGTLFPGAVLSHRTALEGGGATKEGMIILTYKYTKTVLLPGFTIRLFKGPGPVDQDMPFMGKLFLASTERALLENCQTSRERTGPVKTLSRAWLEEYLDKLCNLRGIEELNRIRDQARILSQTLDMDKEFKILNHLIGALLGTREANTLITQQGIARALGMPYDSHRLALFSALITHLNQAIFTSYKGLSYSAELNNSQSLSNLAFFESYFSNYIEGTEFEVNEAADIVFHDKVIPNRSEDSHDIIGTFRIVSSVNEMTRVPHTIDELYDLLQARHAILLSARKDKEPGHFKTKANRAGNTVFVAPELVKGTLEQGFTLYQGLKPGIARAIFMMFLVAEVHPFLDGNGRIARIMMNAELESAGECRIIIPTVYREDYIFALRRLSRAQDPDPYIRALLRAQKFVSILDFSEYNLCLEQLKKCNAFLEPSEGKLII
jgi:hypothetical protein